MKPALWLLPLVLLALALLWLVDSRESPPEGGIAAGTEGDAGHRADAAVGAASRASTDATPRTRVPPPGDAPAGTAASAKKPAAPPAPVVERGTILVRLVDTKQILGGDVFARASPVTPSPPGTDPRALNHGGWGNFQDRVARFPVQVRTDYSVSLVATPGQVEVASVLVRGPQVADECVECTLEVPANLPVLLARIDPTQLLAKKADSSKLRMGQKDEWSEFRLPAPTGKVGPPAPHRITAKLSGDGRLRAIVPPELSGVQVPYIEAVVDSKTRGFVRRPIELLPGDNDLGWLTPIKPTEIVTGSVFDDAGRPVMAAKIEVVEALTSPDKIVVHEVKHSPRSRFVLTAWVYEPVSAPLHLRVTTDYMTPQPDIEFALGTKNLSVIVQLGSHLVAEVVLPDGVPAERLGTRLRRSGTTQTITPSFWSTTPDGGAGEVRWFGLAAGTYELLAQPPRLKAPKVVLAGLRVPEGGRCFDERLVHVDLRSLRDD